MVRAAVTGAFDYTGSDPTNKQWRLRHRLMLSEFENLQAKEVLQAVQQHWLSFIPRTTLTPESFEKIKTHAADTLINLHAVVFPWLERINTDTKPGTISEEDQRLIDKYKALKAQEAAEQAKGKKK